MEQSNGQVPRFWSFVAGHGRCLLPVHGVGMKTIRAIFEDRVKTRFLRDSDVFEQFKAIIKIATLEVVDDFGPSHVKKIIEATEGQPYGVIALFDAQRIYYRDASIKSISDGTEFVFLDEYLEAHVSAVAV